ncbi:hypothetical protein EXIGLDRAFT_758523 [Exidia glandulosa HHB12029]|uniref:Rrn7/TAF1B N-terminal cyclin domain-containing protein n=1 Tax=Exidia glandulosa HHB12029 TaxID=1314781 RepID=A0A165QY36_EXIGL|nr:hypothetical protein EXIGLDRAFT_758523 [Exidia glandulosa HHB12029]
MAKRCPICRSKQWRREMGTGLVVCSEGHVLQNYRNETTEQGDAPGHALKRLRLRSNRKKKAKLSRADPNLYRGARATYLYFQCLQLLLRKQIVVLVERWKLPPEFETLCRDIWAVNLASLPTPPPAEPYLHAGGESEPAPPDSDDDKEGSERDDDNEGDSSSTTDHEDDEDDSEPDEIEARIRELIHDASDSEDEDDSDMDDTAAGDKQELPPQHRGRRRRNDRTFYHDPPANIAVMVVACWMLRVPVMYMDFIKLIDMYTLPYLGPLRYLPKSLVKHVTQTIEAKLSPKFAPQPELLHLLASRLAQQLNQATVVVPEFNGKPMLWRATRALVGSPTLYDLAKVIGHTCSLPFTLHPSITPHLPPGRDTDGSLHQSDNVAPELATANDEADPATALPAIEDYIQAVEAHEQRVKKRQEHLFTASSNASMVEFDEAQVSQYLAFCEKALLDGDASNDAAILATYFPLAEREASEGAAEIPEKGQSEPAREVDAGGVDEDSVLTPGAMLKLYRGMDITGLMPADYDVVLSAAATWCGFSADDVAVVVERYERRLVRWWRRSQPAGSEAPVETDGE